MNEIERKIYQASQTHQIHKSSDIVLEAFENRKPRRQKKFFFIPALTTLLSAGIATALIVIFKPTPLHIEATTNGIDDGTNALTSLVCDLSMHRYVEPSFGSINAQKLSKIDTQDEFAAIASDIDSYYSSYSYFESHRNGFNYSFDATKYEYRNKTYRYQLYVNNTTIYLTDNLNKVTSDGVFEGLIRLDDRSYQCEIQTKANNGYVSTQFKYRNNDTFYTLSHKTTDGVTSIINEVDYIAESTSAHVKKTSANISFVGNIFTAAFDTTNFSEETSHERKFIHNISENYVNVEYKRNSETYSGIKLKLASGKANKRTYSCSGFEDVILIDQ